MQIRQHFDADVPGGSAWWALYTRHQHEKVVAEMLSTKGFEVFLPLYESTRKWKDRRKTLSLPLFPCYLFARLDLQADYFEVKYLAGVTGLVSAGADPIVVPDRIIEEIRARGVNDVIEIREVPFDSGQPVRVVEGPFRGFEAIFERYLSGAERVAILLNTIEKAGPRIVLPASALAKYS